MHNLTDPKEIEEARQLELAVRKQEINDLRAVLSNAAGRRVMWRILVKCGTFNSVFNSDEKYMGYLAGKQDLGHFIMSEIIETDERLLFKLMSENKQGELQ